MRLPVSTEKVTKYPNSETYLNSDIFFSLAKMLLFGGSTV